MRMLEGTRVSRRMGKKQAKGERRKAKEESVSNKVGGESELGWRELKEAKRPKELIAVAQLVNEW